MQVVVDGRSLDVDAQVAIVRSGDRLTADRPVVEVDLRSVGGEPGSSPLQRGLAEVAARACAGDVVVVRIPAVGDDPGASIAVATLAVAEGCRVLRTDDEPTARRVAAVVDAIRRAGDGSAGDTGRAVGG